MNNMPYNNPNNSPYNNPYNNQFFNMNPTNNTSPNNQQQLVNQQHQIVNPQIVQHLNQPQVVNTQQSNPHIPVVDYQQFLSPTTPPQLSPMSSGSPSQSPVMEQKRQQTGRKPFYVYYCPNDKSHTSTKFKNRHICKQCTETTGSRVYMWKKCSYCGQHMKNNAKHYYKCEVFNKKNKQSLSPQDGGVSKQQNMRQLRPISKIPLDVADGKPKKQIINSDKQQMSQQALYMAYIQYCMDQQYMNILMGLTKQSIPQQVKDHPVPLDQIKKWYREARDQLADPKLIFDAKEKLEAIIRIAGRSFGYCMIIAHMEASLSCALWVTGDCLRGQVLLEKCIQKAVEYNDMENWLIWNRWASVREIERGNFAKALQILEPIVAEFNKI